MDKTTSALVSIIIPVYKTTWFDETLACAIAQDYPNCEIIVSDDSPFGEPAKIVEQWRAKSRHPVSYHRNQPALGDIGNYEKCFQLSQGKYVKLFSDDDLLTPDCVSKLVAAIEADDDIRIATSRRQRVNAKGVREEDILATACPARQNIVIHGLDLFGFQAQGPLNFIGEPCSVLLYREDINALMGEPDSWYKIDGQTMHFLEDLTFYSKILRKGHLAWLSETLSFFRISRNQKSEQGRAQDPRAQSSHDIFTCHAEKLAKELSIVPARGVRIAPLHSPQDFVFSDLRRLLASSLKESHFDRWLGARTILPVQRRLIDDFIHSAKLHSAITVIIDGRDVSIDRVTETYNTLTESCFSGLTIEVVVLGDEIPEGARAISLKDKTFIAALNESIAQSNTDWLICVTAGTTFYASGLAALETTLNQTGELLAIYCDETGFIDGHKISAKFRPDFNLDYLLSSPSNMAHHWIWRRELLNVVNGFTEQFPQAFELELALKVIESQGFNSIGHLAEPLLNAAGQLEPHSDEADVIRHHLMNRGYSQAEVVLTEKSTWRLIYSHPNVPRVSLIILAERNVASLMTCVMSLIEKTSWLNYELIIVVNHDVTAEANDWLDSVVAVDKDRVRVQRYAGDQNFAIRANAGASQAQGEYLVIIDSSLAFIDPTWLNALMNHAQRPEVGCVGGKQIYADGTVSHAGYVLGLNGVAGDAFLGCNDQHKGLMSRLHSDQNYSAVSGDFITVRREIFTSLKGFDESLGMLSDVDFCLRLREAGYLTVWTPYAKVLRSTRSGNSDETAIKFDKLNTIDAEEDRLYDRWLPLIANDPTYNPHLSLSSNQFNVCPDSLLSWRPLGWKPLPIVLPHMGDFAGCGYYRIIKPFESMRDNAIVDGKLSETLLSTPYLERFKPDSVIFQRQLTPEFHEWAKKMTRHSRVFKVFELDDYLPNIPLKNHHRRDFGSETFKLLRKSIGFMDRFVVSTQPLAEAFAGIHSDIVVRENNLSMDWWGGLTSLRGQGKKPRVGWAGGSSHTGDLEMIFDVVKAFSDEVEWIFLGMCPQKLRPYISEFHIGVDIERYPAKLASLNLDLALAPVEDNMFNICKSNLRLLEYGACGVPVICSDVECYRGTLPVTRVRNRFKDWNDAIRMHLNDPQTSGQMGEALKEMVMSDYTLNRERTEHWAQAWLP